MSDTHSSGSTGAFQHSKKSKRANPYGYLRALIDDNPDASRSELDEMSADIILKQIANGDHAMFHAIHTYWLTNCYKNLTREPSTDDDAEADSSVPEKGQHGPASASSPEATTEARTGVPNKGQSAPASASPEAAGGASALLPDDEGQLASAPPVRQPPNPPRGLDAIASIQHVMARGLLGTMKLRDGRVWAEVRWSELDGISKGIQEGYIARVIMQQVSPPADPEAQLGAVLVEDQFEECVNAAIQQSR